MQFKAVVVPLYRFHLPCFFFLDHLVPAKVTGSYAGNTKYTSKCVVQNIFHWGRRYTTLSLDDMIAKEKRSVGHSLFMITCNKETSLNQNRYLSKLSFSGPHHRQKLIKDTIRCNNELIYKKLWVNEAPIHYWIANDKISEIEITKHIRHWSHQVSDHFAFKISSADRFVFILYRCTIG